MKALIRKLSLKGIGKFMLFGSAAVIVVSFVAITAWTASGSDKWELEIDRDGVQVYSYKESGTFNKVYKGVTRGPYTQTQVAASLMLENHSLDNCKKWIPVCIDLKVLEPYSDAAQGDSVLWTLELLPPVFKNREYAIKSMTRQDPKTGDVTIDVMAAAQKAPLSDCCIRISHIHNRWKIKPAVDGQVEIELTQDFDMGGFFPDVLINLGNAEETYKLLHDQVPGLIDRPQYKTAKLPYVQEGPRGAPEAAPAGPAVGAGAPVPAGAGI